MPPEESDDESDDEESSPEEDSSEDSPTWRGAWYMQHTRVAGVNIWYLGDGVMMGLKLSTFGPLPT